MKSLQEVVQASWNIDTTSSPEEWNAETAPQRGQCVPTALVVQDYLGGNLERLATEYDGVHETHYRNVVDGEVVDLTRAQYPEDQEFSPAPVAGDLREYVLGNENTRDRYLRLSLRVALLMQIDGRTE